MMIDLQKAQRMLKVSPATLYRYIYGGRLKHRKLAGTLYLHESELKSLVRPKLGRPPKNFPVKGVS